MDYRVELAARNCGGDRYGDGDGRQGLLGRALDCLRISDDIRVRDRKGVNCDGHD